MAVCCKIAAHSAYDRFSQYKLSVNLVNFPTSVFGVGNFYLIVPFPDHCLLNPLRQFTTYEKKCNDTRAHMYVTV